MLKTLAAQVESRPLMRHLFFLACTLGTLALLGYYFGTFDQYAHIPFLKKYADPTLFPNDPFLELRNENYSYFWLAFVPALRAGILEPVMLVVYLAVTYASFWLLWTLSLELFASPRAALLSTIAFVVPHLGFGGFPIFEWSLLNRTFALPFALGAVLLYLRGRPVLAWAVIGALFNVHVITGLFVAAMFGFDQVFCVLKTSFERRRLAWTAVSWVVFVIAASPVLIWRLTSPAAKVPNNPEWFDVVVSGSLANLFQIVSPVPHILFVSACGLSTVALFVIAWRRTPARTDDLQHTVGRMNLAAGLIVAVQAITALVYPVDLINQLQVIRAGMWLNIFAYLWFARYLIEREELLPGDKRLSLLRALYIASPLPLVPALIWWPARRFTRETASLILMAIVAVGLIGGAMAVVLPYGLWRPGFYPYGPTTDWEAIQRCARELTPRDALFITPPEKWGLYDSDWRTFSERSTLATHDELLMIALAPIHYDTWKERFTQVAPGALEQFNSNFFDAQRASRDAYDALSAEQLLAVAQRYDVDFVVREVPNTLPWQALNCDNSQYVIYEVP